MDRALVSACLLGMRCRYDGESKPSASLLARLRSRDLLPIPICPEQMGGLPTPRVPNEIRGGDGGDVLDGKARVLDTDGVDRTAAFIAGAREALRLARLLGIGVAYLKTGSPSCGCGFIKCEGRLVEGDGVTAALLKRHGLKVVAVE